jgi:hypothetical protein
MDRSKLGLDELFFPYAHVLQHVVLALLERQHQHLPENAWCASPPKLPFYCPTHSYVCSITTV